MQDDIPWLSSNELVEDDDAAAEVAGAPDSLRPIELESPLEESGADTPHDVTAPTSQVPRAAYLLAGVIVAGALVYAGVARHPRGRASAASASGQSAVARVPGPAAQAATTSQPASRAVAPAPSTPTTLDAPPQELGLDENLLRLLAQAPAAPATPQSAARAQAELRARATLRKGYASLNGGDAAGALRYAKSVVATAPRLAEGWLLLGSAHTALHETGEAAQAFARCAQSGSGAAATACKRLVR